MSLNNRQSRHWNKPARAGKWRIRELKGVNCRQESKAEGSTGVKIRNKPQTGVCPRGGRLSSRRGGCVVCALECMKATGDHVQWWELVPQWQGCFSSVPCKVWWKLFSCGASAVVG